LSQPESKNEQNKKKNSQHSGFKKTNNMNLLYRHSLSKSISMIPSGHHTHHEVVKPQTRRHASIELAKTEFSTSEDCWGSDRSDHQRQQHQMSQIFTMRDEGKAMTIDGINKSWKIKGRIDSFGGRAILQENGKIIAVVIRERLGARFEYKLLGVTPLYTTQKPHSMKIKNQKLYEHVIVRRTSYFSTNFIIFGLCDNTVYETQGTSKLKPLQLKVFKKHSGQCCGYLQQYFERGNVFSSSWKVRVDKGINPKIMICLTAIANKSMGKAVV